MEELREADANTLLLNNRSLVLCLLSDAGVQHSAGVGSHYGLLVLSRESKEGAFVSLLFDSGGGGGSLEEHAKLIAEAVFRSTFLGTVADGPRQRNSWDCGMVRRV